MADTTLIDRYRKVKRLALEGSPGERENAQRILEKMELENPWLPMMEANQTPHTTNPFTGNWEQIFGWAAQAMNKTLDLAQKASNAQHGQYLASLIAGDLRETRSGNYNILLRIPLLVFDQAPSMNSLQKEVFRKAVHKLLDEQLDILLSNELEE